MWGLNAAAAARPATVGLTPTVIANVVSSPTDARAALIVSNDGITYQELNVAQTRTVINPPDWLDPAIGTNLYEVFVSSVGDALDGTSDVLDTWLSLGTERQWVIVEAASNQDSTAVLTVQIRRVTTVLATADYTLIANTQLP